MNLILMPVAMPLAIRRPTLVIIAALFLLLSSAEAAPEAVPKVTDGQVSALAPQAEFNEVKLLQRQLEDSRKFQDQILSTVYWSLGTLAAVATLLVGFGWFVNFRVYERDKASLERDLRVQMSEDASAFKTEAAAAAATSAASVKQSLATQLAAAEERITARMNELLDAQERKLAARVATNASELNRLKSDVLNLQLEESLRKRQLWEEKKIPRNVLQSSVNALEIANKIGYENGVAEVLDLISKDINSILTTKATPIDNYLVAQLIATLDAVKGGHAHAAATLKAGASTLL
jgi:hypothetical protein